MTASVSVVIPAHDEEFSISRLLAALAGAPSAAGEHNLEIVVACNGCTDATADVARRTAPSVHVIELPTASKPAALRAGDEHVGAFPRAYIDADVVINDAGVLRLAERLDDGGLLAVAPTPRFDASGGSWLVRSHYRFWQAQQLGTRAVFGTGVIMVSASGRARFDTWPDVIGDDYFLDGCFTDAEKCRVPDVEVVVYLPRRFWQCVSRRARVYQGNHDVLAAGLRLRPSGHRRGVGEVVRSRPRLALDLPVHAFVVLVARSIGWWRRRRGTSTTFFRAEDPR